MNKSKFLKKSLAAVLAVLLIAAMIPLSAAAVEAPPVSKITVGGVEATGTGTAREVNLVEGTSLPKVVVQLDANNGGNDGSVWHDDGTGTNTSDAVNTGAGSLAAQWTFTLSEDEYKDGGEVKFRVFHENNVDFADYVITLHFVSGSADNSIKSIGFTNGDFQYGSTTQDENGVYIITAKYGTITPGTDSLTVELGSADATLTGEAGLTITQGTGAKWTIASYVVGTPFNLQVKSQNGELANYQAKVVAPTFFKSISTPNEYKAAEVDLSASPKTIDLYIPFGTKQVKNKAGSKTFYEIPVNFETGYPSAVIKTLAYDVETQTEKKELKSGDKIYIDVTAGTKIDLDYIYNGTTETFKVEANITNDDPAATISAVKVGNYMAKLEGTTFTLELPASFMDLAGSNATALNVKAAKGSTVTLAGSDGQTPIKATITDPTAWEELGSNAFDASKEGTYTLRVVSAQDVDSNGVFDAKDYTLVVKKVAIAEEAAMKAMVLENSDGKQFPAEISGNTIKFKLPYSTQVNDVKAPAAGKEWKLYYDVSSGAYISAPALVVSGSTFDSGDGTTIGIFPSAFDGKTSDGTDIEVVASDNSSKKYKVVVEKLPAATGHSIVKFGVTHDDANKLDDVDKNDIFEATPSGTNVIINVPFSKYGDFDKGSKVVPIFELSEGAKIYRVAKAANNIDNDLAKVAPLTGVTADAPGAAIKTDGVHFDGTAVSSSDSTPKSLCLFVISEGATDPVSGFTPTWKQANAGKYTEYKLQVKKAAANKTVKLDQVKLFNNLTKEEVIGTVNNAAETITFNNIPNHFMANATANHVYLDYKVSKGEGVVIDTTNADNTGTFINPIVYGDNGKIKTVANESDKQVAAITTTPANTSGEATGTYNSLYIESEDGEVGNGTATQSRVYTIKYNVAPAETGATLNSVTINGVTARPDANKKVTITLPMAAEVTSLKPAFDVSKYASVLNGGVSGAVITNGEDSFNFSSARTFTVRSEDKKNTTTYTVEVKVSKDFSDVKPGDWFYSYVMDAVDRGIIIGNGDGTFGPHTNVTRAQFATMMARVDGFDKNAEYTNPFSDMQGITGETLKAIAYCADKGYITGDGDTTFRPNDTISRQEMAVIISRVMKLDVENVEIGTRFADDAKIAGWAKNYVYACVNAKMLMGEGNNTFNPLGSTIRAAAATAAVRVDNAK